MLIVEDDPNDLPSNEVRAFATDPAYELLLIAVILGRNNVYANAQPWTENFDILSNTWYRLRLVAAEPSANLLDLTVVGCRAMTVAYDGVWRSTVPGMESSTFQLTGASRMDLAVLCPNNGSLELNGATIANFNVVGVGSPDYPSPFDAGIEGQTWEPRASLPFDHYLYDQRNNPVDNYLDISMSGAQINGQMWDPVTPLAHMTYNQVQEWTISGTNAHPFHLHVYHMQVVTPGGCGHHEEGEYYDTISGGTCTVRFRLADYGGRVVFHCHVLRHEDNGAMTWVSVDDGPPIDFAYMNGDVCSGGGGGGCVPDGSCLPLTPDQCGITDGVDSCGDPCWLDQAPTCAADQVCIDFLCQTPSTCAAVDQSCVENVDCCSGSCSRGNKKLRVCL